MFYSTRTFQKVRVLCGVLLLVLISILIIVDQPTSFAFSPLIAVPAPAFEESNNRSTTQISEPTAETRLQLPPPPADRAAEQIAESATATLSFRQIPQDPTFTANTELQLFSPLDMGRGVNTKPIFSWSEVAGATKYRVVVKHKDRTRMALVFKGQTSIASICSGGICTVDVSLLDGVKPLKEGKEYSWHVIATVPRRTAGPSGKIKSPSQHFYVGVLPQIYAENFETNGDWINWMNEITSFVAPNADGQALHLQNGRTRLFLKYGYVSDVEIEASVIVNSGTMNFGLRASGAGAYEISVDASGYILLLRDGSQVASAAIPNYSVGQIIRFRSSVVSNVITVTVQDLPLIRYTDPVALPYGVLFIGTGETESADVWLDNLQIAGSIANEPLAGINLVERLILPERQLRVNADIDVRSTAGKIFFEEFYNIYVINADGSNRQLFISGNSYENRPAYSASVNSLAFLSTYDGAWNVWVAPASGISLPRKVTAVVSVQGGPAWSPTGNKITYEYNSNIYVVDVNTLATQLLAEGVEPDWSTANNKIVFADFTSGPGTFLWTINPDGTGKQRVPNIAFKYGDTYPDWSSDGLKVVMRYLPHTSTSTNNQVCIVTISTGAVQCVTSEVSPNPDPVWSSDGTAIAYVTSSGIKIIPAGGGTERTLTTGTSPEWVSGSVVTNPTPTPIRMETLTPTPQPDSNCSDGTVDLIPGWLYLQNSVQELNDMQITTSPGIRTLAGPTLNANQNSFFSWGLKVKVYARADFPQSGYSNQVWYRVSSPGASSPIGWIVARYKNVNLVAGNDPCASIATASSLTFPYNRRAAANYAIEHSYQNDGLADPLSGNRVTRRLTNNQSLSSIPFANFKFSYLSGDPDRTGSAVFVSESIWAGGLPMTIGDPASCSNAQVFNGSGWRYCSSNIGSSNSWDFHQALVAYYTSSQAPTTTQLWDITNTVLVEPPHANEGSQQGFPSSSTRYPLCHNG